MFEGAEELDKDTQEKTEQEAENQGSDETGELPADFDELMRAWGEDWRGSK